MKKLYLAASLFLVVALHLLVVSVEKLRDLGFRFRWDDFGWFIFCASGAVMSSALVWFFIISMMRKYEEGENEGEKVV